MSLNRSELEPPLNPDPNVLPTRDREKPKLDYGGLVRFLVEPFLGSPDDLSVDCERSLSKPKVWIRMAFDEPDKGRVFGRGGRNIQAIRTVLQTAALAAGESIFLDIYGEHGGDVRERTGGDRFREERHSSGRSSEPPPRPRGATNPPPSPRSNRDRSP